MISSLRFFASLLLDCGLYINVLISDWFDAVDQFNFVKYSDLQADLIFLHLDNSRGDMCSWDGHHIVLWLYLHDSLNVA